MSQPPPGQPLPAFLAQLPPQTHLALANRVGAGIHAARHASQCLTAAGTPHHETVPQFLAYLSTAVRELEAARQIIITEIEGEPA